MLIVTIAALVMAASLAWFAYRLQQEEQRRSEARVALLTAALQDHAAGEVDPAVRPTPVGFVAPAAPPQVPVAAARQAHAPAEPELVYVEDDSRTAPWFRSERPQEASPSSALALTGAASAAADVLRAESAPADQVAMSASEVPTRPSGLFADVPEARPADARGAIALAGVVLVAAMALGYVWVGRPAPAASAPAARSEAAPAATAPTQGGIPLELMSLSHEQRAGTLVVRGLVRNPVSGSDRTGLVASVMLLDQAGGFLGSGRAPLETTRLRPGDAVGFAVELPSHKDVRRYRVTFRGVDGGLVPHADRRDARP